MRGEGRELPGKSPRPHTHIASQGHSQCRLWPTPEWQRQAPFQQERGSEALRRPWAWQGPWTSSRPQCTAKCPAAPQQCRSWSGGCRGGERSRQGQSDSEQTGPNCSTAASASKYLPLPPTTNHHILCQSKNQPAQQAPTFPPLFTHTSHLHLKSHPQALPCAARAKLAKSSSTHVSLLPKKSTEVAMITMRFTTLHTPWDTGVTRARVLNANCGHSKHREAFRTVALSHIKYG